MEAERQQETLTYDQGTVYVLKTDEDPLNYGVTESKQTKSGWSFRYVVPFGNFNVADRTKIQHGICCFQT